jgi:two-component system, cell cycle sensor histidine kinase and response regulator CckA
MRSNFEAARLRLARLHIDDTKSVTDVLHHAAKISAHALGVARVGIWFLASERTCLECALVYDRASDQYDTGTAILRAEAPAYFEAFDQRRVIAAKDASTDPVTAALHATYLAPRSIGAMLDAPLYVDGELFGVVCHEHVGGPRDWSAFEIDFVASFADILGALYVQYKLRDAERDARQAAARIQDAAKLASLTHVTRAFAHDVKNALTVAKLTGERLLSTCTGDLAVMGEELARVSDFAARVLRDLQAFAARDGTDVAPIGVIIETFRPVLSALLRGAVALEIRVDDPELTCVATRTQLEQILMNLCINARDASMNGGTVRLLSRRDGDRLLLVVSDEGEGIAPRLLPVIFDSYFTTKTYGSGLGLAIVKEIVADHEGAIELASEVGSGSTFTVSLPLVN